MSKNIFKKKYEGLGFVEALIALSVSGIVAVVLMGISAESIREIRKLDMQDAIALKAVSTAVHVQNLAIREATTNQESNIFYELQNNHCYRFNTDGSLDRDGGSMSFARSDYETSLIGSETEYFTVMCVVHNTTEGDRSKILVKIISGSNKVEGRVTNDYDVKDYEYYSIINL